MATTTIYADTADGYVASGNANLGTARSSTGGTLTAHTSSTSYFVGELFFGSNYTVYQAFESFDTSGVSGTVSSVTLSLWGDADVTSLNNPVLNVRQYDWGTSVTTADWLGDDADTGRSLMASFATSGGWSTSGYNDFTSESGWSAALSAASERLVITGSFTEAGGTGNAPSGFDSYVSSRTADQAGTANDPKLVVVTSDSPTYEDLATSITGSDTIAGSQTRARGMSGSV